MKVSVIIPAYNRAYIIGDALASVLAQTHTDFEVFVVDGASEDNTADVVAEFCDLRIRYFRHERNDGISAARNTALREAQGALISFLDSDDLWKPAKLEKEITFLERHPEAAGVFADLEKYDGGKYFPSFMRDTPYFSKMLAERNYPKEIVFGRREIYLCLLREVPIKPTALTLRAEAARETGFFNEGWPSGEDWEYLLRFCRTFRFGYIDEPLAVYRVQGDAAHRTHVVVDKSLTLALFKKEIAQSKGDREAIEAAEWGYCNMSKHLAWAYLASGQKSIAAKTFARAFRETGDAGMLGRALMAYFPSGARALLKKVMGRAGD